VALRPTAAVALGRKGYAVDVIERDPHWSVYGVGIIQQGNVIRAVAELGILDDYLDAGFPFDDLEICGEHGGVLARIPSPKPNADYPANLGVSRRASSAVAIARRQPVQRYVWVTAKRLVTTARV
jgi:2-polyprenyl-6-methoxyphenol hydroxylase-like FAD-dependent oxidoreductase